MKMLAAKLFGILFTLSMIGCADAQQGVLPIRQVDEIALTGNATRLDYQSFDSVTGRLYIAHLGDSMVTVFDTKTKKIVGDIRELKNVHGVLAVPELGRVYASATGTNELAVIDDRTLQVIARIPVGEYPDGIAYASKEKKLYVSNKNGRSDTVIDAVTNKAIGSVEVGGQAGNSQYDPASDRVYVAVHKINSIVEIDPRTDRVVGTYPLTGCKDSHGLLIDSKEEVAFAACESNATLAMFDLKLKKLISIYQVGDDPDVLAFDAVLRRLYVSAESGVVTILEEKDRRLTQLGRARLAAGAHTVAVDDQTHAVYFPLENVGGKPVLKTYLPTDQP